MSVIPGKTILVVGDETNTVHAVEGALVAAGAHLLKSTCTSVTAETLARDHIDLVLLNHLHDGQHCLPFLNILRTTRIATALPILALVDDSPRSIEHALALGAADYFVPSEPLSEILIKIRVALGESTSTADASVIDLSEVPHSPRHSSLKVFVVEDDPLLVNLLSIRMERAGFSYRLNKTGLSVPNEVVDFSPHVILLDLTLPDVSGFDILEQLKKDVVTASIPVIVFSNRDSSDDRERATELGAARFYVKALTDLSRLIKEVEDLASL